MKLYRVFRHGSEPSLEESVSYTEHDDELNLVGFFKTEEEAHQYIQDNNLGLHWYGVRVYDLVIAPLKEVAHDT